MSQARDRKGKIQTARERVVPANPQTAAQQNQRAKIRMVTLQLNQIGSSFYGVDFNRTVSKLPGYQGLVSRLIAVTDASGGIAQYISEPAVIQAGTLHVPDSFNISGNGSSLDVTWSTEQPEGTDPTDQVRIMVFGRTDSILAPGTYLGAAENLGNRSTGSGNIALPASYDAWGGFVFGLYVRAADYGTTGIVSNLNWGFFEI